MKQYFQLGVALAVLTVTVIGYALWYNTLASVTTQTSSVAAQLAQKTAEEQNVSTAKNALASLAANETTLSSYFISVDDIAPFLEGLSKSGKTLGANVSVVSVSEDAKAAPHGRILLTLRITGTFDSVVRTVGFIEYGPYDSMLTSLTLSTDTAASTTRAWVGNATFSIGKRVAGAVTTASAAPAVSGPPPTTVATSTATTTHTP